MKLITVNGLKKELAQLGKLLKPIAREAFVFGSALKGAVPQESDLDVLIVPKGKLSYKTAYNATAPAFDKILESGLVLHLVIVSKRHNAEFLQHAKHLKIA